MNQGELIQSVRLSERTLLIQEERIAALEKKVYEMDEILKSPIRRQIYATREKRKQESDVGEHSSRDARGEAAKTGDRHRL